MESWLHNSPARLLFSQQLRKTGRFILDEVRAKHFPFSFARLLNRALRSPGKLLSSPVMQGGLVDEEDLHIWALLALLAAASASGAQISTSSSLPLSFWRRAHAAAAAAELLGVALDVIDDVQDGDNPFVQRVGAPIALNIGVALLELVPLALGRARAAGWPDPIADAALETLHSSILTSLGGQFLDLHFEQRHEVTEAAVLEMSERKSGTLLALVCQLGAMAGMAMGVGRPAGYIEEVGLFGWHLGVWSQLLNDLHSAELSQTQSGKSDRQRGKKTLPLLLEKRGMIEEVEEAKGQWSLNTQAAFSYTYVAAEIFRLRAQKVLQALEQRFGPHPLLWPLTEYHQRKRIDYPT